MNSSDYLTKELMENRDFPILDDKYFLIKKIGSGATCKVKLAKSKDSDEFVAVKILKKATGSSNSIAKYHTSEIDMLKQIQHPNIINLLDGGRGLIKKSDGRTKKVDYIILEYAGNAELFDYIYFPREGLGEKMARSVFKMLIDGLEGCHNSGVTHRDLKTENIMMNFDWMLKIADFGYATLLSGKKGDGLLTSFLGTLSYCAPEILNKKPYVGSCADIFSCGVILFVIVTGRLPFGKATIFDAYYKNIIKKDYEIFWSNLKALTLSNDFKSLINSLLAYDPKERPSITEIKDHPWLNKETPTDEEFKNEFERRKNIVKIDKEIEAQEELKKKKKTKNNGVFRSDNGDDSDENTYIYKGQNLTEYFEGERKVDEWIDVKAVSNPYKLKLKGSDFNIHLNYIANYFMTKDQNEKNIIIHKNLGKFNINYAIDKEILENFPDLNIEKLSIEIDLKRIDDENFVAEFTKLGGDKLEFFNEYNQFIEFTQSTKDYKETE
jgi:serine/threonine protein kinase